MLTKRITDASNLVLKRATLIDHKNTAVPQLRAFQMVIARCARGNKPWSMRRILVSWQTRLLAEIGTGVTTVSMIDCATLKEIVLHAESPIMIPVF